MCPKRPASMMRLWSDGQSLDRVEPIRKDAPMLDLTRTSCKVNDLWISETLAKAERHHALTRSSAAPGKPAAIRFSLRIRRIFPVNRLAHRKAQTA
jgi:hypothetical protein